MKSRPKGGFVIQTLDSRLRGNNSKESFRGDDGPSVINRPIHVIVVVLDMEHLDARHALVTQHESEFVDQGLPVEGFDAAAQHVVEFQRQFLVLPFQPGQLATILPGGITGGRGQARARARGRRGGPPPLPPPPPPPHPRPTGRSPTRRAQNTRLGLKHGLA